ncbi:MAG: oligosaccharide flippase family protein [Candidatus Wallbacteria bacterium]|nr:oligosaccharide flippase family protein [Candidatus Wallbacteria bacterium]
MRKKVIDYLLGNLGTKIFSFLAVILVGGFLAKKDIGILTLIYFIAEIIAIIVTCGLDASLIKFYRDYKIEIVLSNTFFVVSLNLLLSVPFYLTTAYFLNDDKYGFMAKDVGVIYLLIFSIVITNLATNHFVSLGESGKVKKYSIISSLVNLTSIVIFIKFGHLNEITMTVARIFSMVIFILAFIRIFDVSFDKLLISKSKILEILKYSLPIVLSSIIGMVNLYYSRIILSKYVSVEDLGIYSYFLMIITSASFLLHSFNQAWSPTLFDRYKEQGTKTLVFVNSVFFKACLGTIIMLILTALLVVVSNYFSFDLKGYYIHRGIFFILLDSFFIGILYTLINPIIFLSAKTIYITYVNLFMLSFNLIVTSILVKYFELQGASISTSVGSILIFYLYLFFSSKAMNNKLILTKTNFILSLVLTIGMLMKDFVLWQ